MAKDFHFSRMDTSELQRRLKEPPTDGRKRAVLLSTGSLCPIHKGHLQNFDIAAKFLSEKCQIDSLVGYISPSCDLYVSHKLGRDNIPFKDRYEMTKLACDEHNKEQGVLHIVPDSWEGLQPRFYDFPEVRDHFEEELQKKFPDENLMLLYVTGADHFMNCGLYNSRGYVAISRVGYQIRGKSRPERNLYICNDPEYGEFFSDVSSTKIRKAMREGTNIDGLTYESVVEYINQNVKLQ